MDNILSLIRRNRLFGMEEPRQPFNAFNNISFKPDESVEEEGFKPFNYTMPENESLKAYRSHIERMPNRRDYEPNKMGKILAAAAGMLTMDPGFTESLLDRGYSRAMGDFSTKAQQLGTLANIEQDEINNRYKIALDTAAENRQLMNTLSQMGLRSARINDMIDQAKSRGSITVKSEIDGYTYRVDKNGNAVRLMKSDETASERDKRQRNLFTFQEGERRETHRQNRDYDVENPLRDTGIQPTQQNAAYRLAVQRVLVEKPEYQKFMDDETGLPKKPTARFYDGATQQDFDNHYKSFINDINTRVAEIEGKGKKLKTNVLKGPDDKPKNPPTNNPSNNVPETRTISREEAIQALEENGIEVNEENIKLAMDPRNWIEQ